MIAYYLCFLFTIHVVWTGSTSIGILLEHGHTLFGDGHYYHVMEEIITAYVRVTTLKLSNDDVTWIAFHPFHKQKWRGKNDRFINSISPICNLLWKNIKLYHIHPFPTANEATIREKLIKYEIPEVDQLIFIDRMKEDHGQVNKMFLKSIAHFNQFDWYQRIISSSLPLQKVSINPKKQLNVIYIDRQATMRKLSSNGHTDFVNHMQMFTEAHNKEHGDTETINFNIVKFENYTFEQQFNMVKHADVLIGVHGNGMTHQLLMHPRRYVIEIFPYIKGSQLSWVYDYYFFSLLMGHRYLCIHNGMPIDTAGYSHDLLMPKALHKNKTGHWPARSNSSHINVDGLRAIIGMILEAKEILM